MRPIHDMNMGMHLPQPDLIDVPPSEGPFDPRSAEDPDPTVVEVDLEAHVTEVEMFHCLILEHAERGMMGMREVGPE